MTTGVRKMGEFCWKPRFCGLNSAQGVTFNLVEHATES
jgi:hypothetical protein